MDLLTPLDREALRLAKLPADRRATEIALALKAERAEGGTVPPANPEVLLRWYRDDAAFHQLVDALVARKFAASDAGPCPRGRTAASHCQYLEGHSGPCSYVCPHGYDAYSRCSRCGE